MVAGLPCEDIESIYSYKHEYGHMPFSHVIDKFENSEFFNVNPDGTTDEDPDINNYVEALEKTTVEEIVVILAEIIASKLYYQPPKES